MESLGHFSYYRRVFNPELYSFNTVEYREMAWKNAIYYRSNISSNVSLKFSSSSLSDISNCLSLFVKSFYCLVIPSFSITSFGKKNIFIYLSCRRLPKNFSYELGSGNCDYANCD